MKLVELTESVDVNQQVWLHGSPHQLSQFKVGTTGEDIYGRGVYLTTSPVRVKTYFDQKTKQGFVHTVKTHCTNPFNFKDTVTQETIDKLKSICNPELFDAIVDQDENLIGREQANLHMILRRLVGTAKVNNVITALGFDCLLIPSAAETVLVVFDESKTEIIGEPTFSKR